MKVFFRTIHLYLSLAAGLFITISCITGTIMVFEEEIQHYFHSERYHVTPLQKTLPTEQLIKQAAQSLPNSKATSIKIYSDKSRSVEIGLTVPSSAPTGLPDAKETLKGEGKKENPSINITAYVNPHTGKVLDLVNQRKSYFKTVEMFHRFLLGGKGSIGNYVMSFSTAFFSFIIITGLILWWPKTKAILKQRLKVKSNSGTKRLNHDLHVVTGFYLSLFLLVTVITGLIMTYPQLSQLLFKKDKAAEKAVTGSIYSPPAKPVSIDQVLLAGPLHEKAEYKFIRFPKDSLATFSISVLPADALPNQTDTYLLDQYSGEIVGKEKFTDKSSGERLRSYVKPIHTGAIYGLPTKTISFIVCLMSIAFPITGTIMWLNRTRKTRGKQPAV